ncbi:hypothetical protein PUN28_014238 [Cardiocondyla obscurior]|uniref:Uncharacterized protein n=1 Tax=Cardiocondyla obscurior TaxID=286306 RepID=A0AAW2F441_9HYME
MKVKVRIYVYNAIACSLKDLHNRTLRDTSRGTDLFVGSAELHGQSFWTRCLRGRDRVGGRGSRIVKHIVAAASGQI